MNSEEITGVVEVPERHGVEMLGAVVNVTIHFASQRFSQLFQEPLAKCRLSNRDWSDLSHFEWNGTLHTIIKMPLDWGEILTILFVVFNPLKVISPFVTLTRETQPPFRQQLAMRATFFAAIGVLVAGIVGQRIWANWGIRDAILLLAGGIVWFLVALFMVLQPYLPVFQRDYPVDQPSLALAFKPLAFPTIVTPYGVATLIVLMATMQTIGQQAVVLGLTGAILLLNWVAMIFARSILRLLAVPLELISWTLGILQVAIGLDLIYIALVKLSVIP